MFNPTNAKAVEEMTSSNTSVMEAVQSDLTLLCAVQETEAEICW